MLSVDKARLLVEVWPEASSLSDAIQRIGMSNRDARNNNRIRREAEQITGVTLPPHNEQHSSETRIDCPSTLDIKKAAKSKAFVITSCTSDTDIESNFLESLEEFSDKRGAQLIIVPLRYKNPSLMTYGQPLTWDERITPYALLSDLIVNKGFMISGLRLPATAVNPLSGLGANSGTRSAVYGHPQLAMQLIATPRHERPKIIHTSGSISHAQYSSSKAGGKAHFNHSISAVYVQIERGVPFMTQLGWDGSGFYFLDEYYGSETPEGAPTLDIADTHAKHEDKNITKARERVKARLQPDTLVWHDIHDHYSQSHHHNLLKRIEVALEGSDDVEEEIKLCAEHLNAYGMGYHNLIIQSNHDDHLEKWLCNFNPKHDPRNAPFYGWMLANYSDKRDDERVLELALRHRLDIDCEFVDPNDSHLIYGIDVSQHGHRGANGSKGSAKNFANTLRKTFIGHTHTPQIEKGCWVVGTSTLNLDYASGLSSWAVCDGVIYPNGKRALIFYFNNKSLFDY